MKFGKKLKIVSKKELDSEPVHNKKYPKAKIKPYNGKISAHFYNDKIRKKVSRFICFIEFFCVYLSYQLFSILFLERVKIIILKCF